MSSETQKPFGILIPESGGDAGLAAHNLVSKHILLNGADWETISIDADEYSPSYFHSNFYKVPYATDEKEYLDTIHELIKRHNIKVVLPTGDFDPKTLASYRMAFLEHGVILAMSQPIVYEQMEDKWLFSEENPEVSPKTWVFPEEVDRFPVFAKPQYGVGSRGIRVINSPEEMRLIIETQEPYIFQELMDGQQFTVDVLCSLDGQPLQAVTRKVYRLKGGADTVAHVIPSPKMEKIAMDLCRKYGVIGAGCFEFMFDDVGEPKVIDAQPRLSGGHQITAIAGLDIPVELIKMIQGGTFEPRRISMIEVVRTLEGVRVV